ncbi:type II toxin-antitoxin system RelE/ParE family toxin [Lacipirellula sp.]|uniref:type II toxin-antitoxin system RelE/ParE family toxin n=1 Tax=Lacipirellula sp. TaxID=2691419 RepID=UPI003D124435
MTYRVIIQPSAFADLEETLDYLAKHYSSASSEAWYEGCLVAIESLAENPHRCPLAKESAKIGVEIRQCLYRRHRSVYRILFTIRDDAVRVLYVRHSARDDMTPRDLGDQP